VARLEALSAAFNGNNGCQHVRVCAQQSRRSIAAQARSAGRSRTATCDRTKRSSRCRRGRS